jgi:hypothetical protein
MAWERMTEISYKEKMTQKEKRAKSKAKEHEG